METWMWIALIVVAIAVVAAVAWWLMRKRQSDALREHFGPEYRNAVEDHGDRGRAEQELRARQERVEKLHIRPLAPEDRSRYADAWKSTQVRFVDDPAGAITEADRLIGEVMQARGYPMGDFEQRAADISVDHPDVVKNYRTAYRIALANKDGQASTEDLRLAMVHCRSLFEELLETSQLPRAEARR